MDTTTWPTAAVALIALGAPLTHRVLRRRRRRAAVAGVSDPVAAPVEEQVEEPHLDDVMAVAVAEELETRLPDPEPVEIRALRLQVCSLEEALVRMPAQPDDDADATYRRQVRLTVRALAATTPTDESPHRTLARVSAAIDRLEAPAGLVRPVLTPTTHRVPAPVRAAAVPRFVPVTPATQATQAPVTQAPGAAPVPTPAVERRSTPVAPEVVLPVPPPAPCPPKRSRRRLRRQAA